MDLITTVQLLYSQVLGRKSQMISHGEHGRLLMTRYSEFSGPKVAHRVEADSTNWIAAEDLSDPRTAGWGLGSAD